MNDSNSLDALLTEERELQYPSCPIAIEVSRNGQQLFFAALPGATPDNAE